jgi:hypothetical protein
MFTDKSRYAKVDTYVVPGPEGTDASVVAVPPALNEPLLGIHLRKDGQRPDHLAFRYLNDAAGFWRLCERNDAVLPEALSEAREIEVPRGRP